MTIWFFLTSILAVSAFLFFRWKAARLPVAWIAIATGISVFAIRLAQPGSYAMPSGGNLISGLLSIGLGLLLLVPVFLQAGSAPDDSPRAWLQRILLGASPVLLFVALYSTLAELEEVVVLHSTHQAGHPVDLRLWIVDDDGAGWIQMPRAKAEAHGLDETRIDMTRMGIRDCVDVKRFSNRENTRRVHHLRHEKYLVQRLATAIGIFTAEPTDQAVVLRITDCESR